VFIYLLLLFRGPLSVHRGSVWHLYLVNADASACRATCDLQSNSLDVSVEPLREVPVHDPAEDKLHGAVVKLVDGDGVEVAEEPRGDGVTPTSWGTHGRYQQNIHQVDLMEEREYV